MVMVNFEADPSRQHPRATTETLAEERLDLHDVRVLAVDDEADARHLIKRILSGCGAQVETADCGASAVRILRKSKSHVLIRQSSRDRAHGFRTIGRS